MARMNRPAKDFYGTAMPPANLARCGELIPLN